jgi:hypothetical protein
MIPFFRKIRKKMADDNKPIQYMRYAVGEIVLVVIGILIALQINNWNEERKKRITERKLLIGLQEDLSRNKELIEDNIRGLSFISDRIESLLRFRADKIAYSDTLNGYFHLARVFPQSTISFLAFNEIEANGSDIIVSTELRNNIIHLFKITLPDMIETSYRLEGPLRDIQLEHQGKNFFVMEDAGLMPNDGERIMLDEEYFNIISQRRQYYKYFTSMKENSLKELIIVQDMIKQELTK